ncbi:hypothetical protein [Aeoliella sp. SH292]|uniref:hypothetical protein n=1 Tax=Aeoliella sp. SH292 TaxID=3454464 RepID=UPI003F9579EE
MTSDYWYIDEIRDAVSSPQTADPGTLREAAVAYNSACRDANRRLREVERLLRMGLRSEAIQAAEQEPALLDHVSELDLAIIEDWQGMLAQWGMELPPELEVGIAAELNLAYAELMPIEQLIKQHRLLALARAPLSARLSVLRQIASRDEMNPGWASDVTQYEQARLREVGSHARQAAREGDVETLRILHAELTAPAWISEVPQSIVNEVSDLCDREVQRHARGQLEQLVEYLDRAYSEFDTERAMQLADRWQEFSTAARLTPSDPLAVRARESLEWIDRERDAVANDAAFGAAVHALESALDQNASYEQIDKLLHRAERFDQAIPQVLYQRTIARLDAMKLQARRKLFLIGGVATLCVLATAGAIFYYGYASQQESIIAQHETNVRKLLDEHNWSQANDYVTRLDATMLSHPRISAVHSEVQTAIQNEQARANRVAAALEQAEQMDVESPDQALLSRLQKEELLPEEKQRLDGVLVAVGKVVKERQRRIDEAFLATVESWAAKLVELEQHASEGQVDLHSELAKLNADLGSHAGVTFALKRQGEPLLAQLRAIINREAKLDDARQAKEPLFSAVGNVPLFASHLEALAGSKDDTLTATHARQVLDEKAVWASMAEWSAFWQAHGNWASMSAGQAQALIEEGDRLLAQSTACELSNAFSSRKEYLQMVANRSEVDVSSLKSFLISNKLVNDVWMVEQGDRRYYCSREPQEDEVRGMTAFAYFKDYASEQKRELLSKSVTTDLAPQAKCSKQLQPLLAKLTDDNWDKSFHDMAVCARSGVDAQPSMDAVLAMDMLRRILTTGSEGSYLFKLAYAQTLQEIDESGVDLSVYWFVPGDRDADTTRREAAAVLAGLPDFTESYRQAKQAHARRCSPPTVRSQWIAGLDRDANGKWIALPPPPSNATGEIAVATKEGEQIKFTQVGTVSGGVVQWDTELERQAARIGTPLFLLPSN